MEKPATEQRSIIEKWQLQYHKDTDIHRAGFVLPPGRWEEFDPFLLMAEDVMKQGAFDQHPHRGIETVTYMINGELDHFDNQGGRGRLYRGDTQWLTAGKGILHLEEAPKEGFAHLLQLWVNLPAKHKMDPYRYQDLLHADLPRQTSSGTEVVVISGKSGHASAQTLNYTPVLMLEITMKETAAFTAQLPPKFNGFIYILDGEGEFGTEKLKGFKQEVLWLSRSNVESEVMIKAVQDLKILLIAGLPIGEPVVARGPFVMNTEQELAQAFKDFREGKFGPWSPMKS